MTINWMCGIENWAFRILCKRGAKAMPEHNHKFNDTSEADIVFAVTTPILAKIEAKHNVILHLDSFRALRI